MRIYWIDKFLKGNIGMMARPKGNDWLEDEIIKLKQLKIDTVVSLLEIDEIIELEIEREEELCRKNKLNFINYPIRDRSVPQNKDTFFELISKIDKKIKDNKNVVIHCRMGIGRTSIVAAAVLIKNGINGDNIFDILTEKRTLNVPDTLEQKHWVLKLKNEIKQTIYSQIKHRPLI